MRKACIERKTAETDIKLSLCLDECGKNTAIDTGCGFFDHMLTLFAKHARIDLDVRCVGDVKVDYHHSVEDIGICLGLALKEALGDCKGIRRYGNMILPMDEALILTAVDISGRAHLEFDAQIPAEKVGDFDTELCEEFWEAFVRESSILHFRKISVVLFSSFTMFSHIPNAKSSTESLSVKYSPSFSNTYSLFKFSLLSIFFFIFLLLF